MKYINTCLFLISFSFAQATNYYLSSSSGNDNNTGIAASSAWKTIGKLNSMLISLLPGDSVLFKRGDTFYGELIISKSGSASLPIVFSAYGKGAAPLITGFTGLSGWEKVNDHLWESENIDPEISSLNMVMINGNNIAMGRFPNKGYFTYQSFSPTSIISDDLNGNTNWTGATVVIRKNNWILDKDTITGQVKNMLIHTKHTMYNGINNYGFFIENDVRTLDETNEWFYDRKKKKLIIYSADRPAIVYASTLDTLVDIQNVHHITFSNLHFTGANEICFSIRFSNHIRIENCGIDFTGKNAIISRGGRCEYFQLTNSVINHTNNNAVDLGGASPDCLLSKDTILNTGMIAGMGESGDGTYIAVQLNSDSSIVKNCIIENTGYNGIDFYGNNSVVSENFVSDFCLTKIDGGGLYTFISINGKPFTGEKLLNNIVVKGIGSVEGTTEKIPLVHGIYLDEGTANVEISGNTLAYNSYSGLYYHSSYSNNVHNNILFDNYCQFFMADYNAKNPDRNLNFSNNILVAKQNSQQLISFQSRVEDIALFAANGEVDNNYFLVAAGNPSPVETSINNYKKISRRSFPEWQSYSGYDHHSVILTKTGAEIAKVRLEYNPTLKNKTVALDGIYVDIKNKQYPDKVILPPYNSIVLIRKPGDAN